MYSLFPTRQQDDLGAHIERTARRQSMDDGSTPHRIFFAGANSFHLLALNEFTTTDADIRYLSQQQWMTLYDRFRPVIVNDESTDINN